MDNFFSRKDLIYAVYQEQSISKAAQKLFISQPSLSSMLKKVEADVGMPLFDRSCKPLRPTEAGREYLKAAEEIWQIERSFYNYVAAVNDLQAGSLSVGSNQLISALLLPRYVSEFIRRYPHIRLELVDASSAELERRMAAGQLDLVIDSAELDPESFERRHLKTEQLLLAVPASFPSNGPAEAYQISRQAVLDGRHASLNVPAVPLAYFAGEPFILMTRDNDTRVRSDEIFRAEAFSPAVILEIDRLTTLFHYIEIGTAATIVSDTLIQNAEQNVDAIRFYKLPHHYAQREIYAHYKRNKYYSQALASFLDILMNFS